VGSPRTCSATSARSSPKDASSSCRKPSTRPFVPDSVARFLINVVRKTRELPGVLLGASPRSAIHLLTAAKAKARLSGRDHVTVDDVVAMAPLVLAHRIVGDGADPADVVRQAVEATLPSAVTPG
jgi:MoxR-like ATPase